jgi:hypothetical protein
MKGKAKKAENKELVPFNRSLINKDYFDRHLQNYVFKEVENKCDVSIGPMKIFQIDYIIKKVTARQMSAIDSKNFFCSFFRLDNTINHFNSLGLSSVVSSEIQQALETDCVIYVEEKTGDMHIRPDANGIRTGKDIIFKAFEPFFRPKTDRPKSLEYRIEGAKVAKKTKFKNKD